jgi:hypothetical protein
LSASLEAEAGLCANRKTTAVYATSADNISLQSLETYWE